jgi:hypothetical protein
MEIRPTKCPTGASASVWSLYSEVSINRGFVGGEEIAGRRFTVLGSIGIYFFEREKSPGSWACKMHAVDSGVSPMQHTPSPPLAPALFFSNGPVTHATSSASLPLGERGMTLNPNKTALSE